MLLAAPCVVVPFPPFSEDTAAVVVGDGDPVGVRAGQSEGAAGETSQHPGHAAAFAAALIERLLKVDHEVPQGGSPLNATPRIPGQR
ncbi:hypothetical protein GCM10027598_70720 [Amycolatopsis oliviviridis]|uniref:Uncharacterized protein n=1 Tax=Amycolatopsis oliviviridis TaxID=1471590 RepID=A0ABQ3L301_9PSEU|nr:hypothetical protein [Amycolatopsis oliviviridis]GHH01013.1 hypothetical protein GCM10017790_00650 [Amycolatopsis oliviviridis]